LAAPVPVARFALAALALGVTLMAILLCAASTLGADPSAIPVIVLGGGDARSEGSGPGLVGSPLVVLGGVIALGLVTALVTILLARLARRA
jgi:hypothetical protein